MFPTKNDLPPAARTQAAALLNRLLAAAMDLYARAKNAHWNTKGPNFFALHELFDEVADYAASSADDIAERAVALGGVADGTAEAAHLRSILPPPSAATQGPEFVRSLSAEVAVFANAARAAIEEALEIGDQATADLFIEVARRGDKRLWFLEAHLQ